MSPSILSKTVHEVIEPETQETDIQKENILENPKNSLGNSLNMAINIVIIIGVLIVIIETIPGIDARYAREFFIIDIIIGLIFAAEYMYGLFHSERKLSFILRPFHIIDLLSFAPFFIGIITHGTGAYGFLRVLRIFRVLRLFEITYQSPIIEGFGHTIHKYRKEYKAIFGIFVSLLIVISTFAYYAEAQANSGFSSIPEALWWGVVTMTTVGYGDIVPVTPLGRMFGVFLILLGPVLLAVISSITILVFMDVAESQKNTVTKICRTCETRNPEDANFCFHCGEQHFTDTLPTERKSVWKKMLSRL